MAPNKFVPLPISPCQRMTMNNFGKRSSMQPMGRLNMHSWWALFFSFWRQRWRGIFNFFFPLFSMCFPTCSSSSSQSVPECIPLKFAKFPSCSLSCSQKHLNFIPYGLPKVQLSCIYSEKVSTIRDYICFYFATWCPKRCFHWGGLNVPNFLLMGQWIWLF